MSKFTHPAPIGFGRSRLSEAVVEVGLTVAAAGFTAAVWLSIGSWGLTPERAVLAAAANRPAAATHVTLPRVEIVGRRDDLEGTPVTTTAQNTAAIPVTLKQ
jgi:hypothetical protein